MTLVPACLHCDAPLVGDAGEENCATHGESGIWWRPALVGYEAFAGVLQRSGDLPVYLPWPLPPGWEITEFGCVTGPEDRPLAVTVTVAGHSQLDGYVAVQIITEEPAVGFAERILRIRSDAEEALASGPAMLRLHLEGHSVGLWPIAAAHDTEVLGRAGFVGEADGRWLWLVVRPASAALLLRDDWLLADATGFGPEALELPFIDGGDPRSG